MNANFFQAMTSFTAAATIDGFDERSPHPRTFEVAEDGASPKRILRKRRVPTAGGPCDPNGDSEE